MSKLLHPSEPSPGMTHLISLWRERVRVRRQLKHLDDRLLDDIGRTRTWRDRETRKPF